jgi:hypothetical protein
MSVIVLDAGNSIIKAKIPRREEGEISFPHSIKLLTETEYQTIQDRAGTFGLSEDYIRVNGQPYVVGESAERHGIHVQRNGAARYTRDYLGIFAASVMARFYERSRDVRIFASHPPGDVKFREDLMRAVIGDWEVETSRGKRTYKVNYANTFDEPVGGLMNVLLTEDGQHYQRSEIKDGRALVIDVGGFTTDWVAVNPGGEIDYSLVRSVSLGIQNVVSDFEESFRAHNLQAVKNTPSLPPERVRKAIMTGIFEGGGQKYPCEQEAKEAMNLLLNRIGDTYQRLAGGALNWDFIILTGGGCGLLHNRLKSVLDHRNVILAEDASELHLANVRGGMKLWRCYEALNVL